MKLLEEMKIIEEVHIADFLGGQKQGEELQTHMGDKEDRDVKLEEPDEEELNEAPGGRSVGDTPADRVYQMLGSQTFADWYEGDFMAHIEGDEGAKEQDAIIADINGMIRFRGRR